MQMYAPERTAPDIAPGIVSASARGQILVVEDDVRMQKILYRLFTEQGYAVTICGD